MNLTLTLFLIVVGITLVITGWAARRTRTTVQFWAAGRGITGWQNGLAISGDYMSAASFLGIAGLIAFNGYDGFMYSVGWLVAYLTVLFLIAEPMRNTGKYTMADVLAYRMSPVPVRSAAAFATVAVSASYMMAQMIGAGSLIKILIPTLDTNLKPYFNVPNAKAARQSVAWAMGLIGSFYIMTTFLGFGAATLVGKAHICASIVNGKCVGKPNSNLAAPRLAEFLGGQFFGTTGAEFLLAFISAVAFATILAVGAGLPLAAAGALSHDFYANMIRTHLLNGQVSEREQVTVARITAGLVGLLSIWLAARVGATANAAALVAGVAFVIASAANLPAILFTLFWKRFNTWGAVASLVGGSLVTIWLVAIGPGWTVPVNAHPAFPLQNVGIVSIPIGFVLAIVGTYLGELVKADRLAEQKFHEIDVRAQTGLGAEPVPAG